MKIEETNKETIYLKKTIWYEINIDGEKVVEITKHYFEDINGCCDDVDWNFIYDKDQKWFEGLGDEQSDELEEFISNLG